MNNQIERYAVENAQHDAKRLAVETGVEHIVKTIRDGIFVAVPVQVDDALPRHDGEPPVDDFLTGEQIPPEVKKNQHPRAILTTKSLMMIAITSNWIY